MMINNQEINRISIIMLGLMGDVLMRTPVLHEMKKMFPNSKICAIVDPIGYEILKDNIDVDDMIVMRRQRKNKFGYLKSKLTTQLKIIKESFDLIIDLYGGRSSHKMMKLSGAKYQIGFVNGKKWTNHKSLQPYINKEIKFENSHHLTNKLFQLLVFFEDMNNNPSNKPIFYLNNEVSIKMGSYVKTFEYENFFLISLGSGGVEKILDVGKQFKLIKKIFDSDGIVPAIILNPGQEFLQENLIKQYFEPSGIPYIKLPLLNLGELGSLMKLCKFIVVPDTGLYHIAIALEIPILGIFTYTNPLLVLPSSDINAFCFQETNECDLHGVKLGKKEIEDKVLFQAYEQLADKLKNN